MNLQTLDWSTILIDVGMLAFLILAVVVVVRLLAKPIKALLKFLVHAATGILVFYAVNYVGGRFFGFTISPETRSRTNNGYTYTVEYKNNAYYYPAADGESYNSFTVVRTMTRYDGHYLVEFDVYELDLETYWEKGFSDLYYELTADEAASRNDVSYSYSGIAEVRDYTNGTFKSYQLLNYKVE